MKTELLISRINILTSETELLISRISILTSEKLIIKNEHFNE